MRIDMVNGYGLYVPTSGGKAGTGLNKTSSLQVRAGGCIVKQFRFTVLSPASRAKAVSKAREYALSQPSEYSPRQVRK